MPINRWVFRLPTDTGMTEDTKAEKAVFEIHDEMHPRFWSSPGVLVEGLRGKLLAIAKKYIDYLKLPEHIRLRDITFTGSLAGYNYTDFSDVDLHIIIDYQQFADDEDFIGNYFRAMKDLWIDTHEVTVFGYPVELYAQDEAQYLDSPGAQYSLIHQKWVKEPQKSQGDVDKSVVLCKAQELQDRIDTLMQEDPSEDLLDEIEIVKKRIKNMRQSGLEKGGEFSPENLAFKLLRNNGYLEKLSQLNKTAQESLLSVEEGI